jgi:signal transduction histidine kinase
VRVEVIDRGAGIARDDWPRVFTPFFRADRSRTRATGGVGLGLVLVRRINEAHGGAIAFESEPDVGSRSGSCCRLPGEWNTCDTGCTVIRYGQLLATGHQTHTP